MRERHRITETDHLVLHKTPGWHGLGKVVQDAPSPKEALQLADKSLPSAFARRRSVMSRTTAKSPAMKIIDAQILASTMQ